MRSKVGETPSYSYLAASTDSICANEPRSLLGERAQTYEGFMDSLAYNPRIVTENCISR